MEIQSIPLNMLSASANNVRKTGGKNVAELAASIEAHGLLQNLTVVKNGLSFDVIAGGRRLLALQQLVKEQKLAEDANIPCHVIEAAAAGEASLAENTIREAMHPADQFEAFKKLIEAGKTEEDIGARFSVSTLFVKQRMKLANLSPKILQAFRDGKLGLQEVEAFAISNDHQAQERTLKQGITYAHGIRQALTKGEVAVSNKKVKFITLAAYEAAGGSVRRDMFDTSNTGYITDVKLLDKLVAAKLEEKVAKVQGEGWSFVDSGVDLDTYRYGEMPGKASEIDKKRTGAVVTISYNGTLEIKRGLLKPGQRAPAAAGKSSSSQKAKTGMAFSQTQILQAHRTNALREHLAKNPRIALAALAATLCSGIASHSDVDRIVRIGQSNHFAPINTRKIVEEGSAATVLEEIESKIEASAPKKVSLFEWLLSQPESVTHEMLAYATASALVAIDGVESKVDSGIEFCTVAGVDMSKCWQVTEEWLAQQSTAYIVDAVVQARGKDNAKALMKLKGKKALAKMAADLINPPDAIVSWLPAPLRPFVPAAPKPPKKAKANKK